MHIDKYFTSLKYVLNYYCIDFKFERSSIIHEYFFKLNKKIVIRWEPYLNNFTCWKVGQVSTTETHDLYKTIVLLCHFTKKNK